MGACRRAGVQTTRSVWPNLQRWPACSTRCSSWCCASYSPAWGLPRSTAALRLLLFCSVPPSPPQVATADLRDPSSLSAVVAGVDAVCCCTGTTAFPSNRCATLSYCVCIDSRQQQACAIRWCSTIWGLQGLQQDPAGRALNPKVACMCTPCTLGLQFLPVPTHILHVSNSQVAQQQRAPADRPGGSPKPHQGLSQNPQALCVCDVSGCGAAKGVPLGHPQHIW